MDPIRLAVELSKLLWPASHGAPATLHAQFLAVEPVAKDPPDLIFLPVQALLGGDAFFLPPLQQECQEACPQRSIVLASASEDEISNSHQIPKALLFVPAPLHLNDTYRTPLSCKDHDVRTVACILGNPGPPPRASGVRPFLDRAEWHLHFDASLTDDQPMQLLSDRRNHMAFNAGIRQPSAPGPLLVSLVRNLHSVENRVPDCSPVDHILRPFDNSFSTVRTIHTVVHLQFSIRNGFRSNPSSLSLASAFGSGPQPPLGCAAGPLSSNPPNNELHGPTNRTTAPTSVERRPVRQLPGLVIRVLPHTQSQPLRDAVVANGLRRHCPDEVPDVLQNRHPPVSPFKTTCGNKPATAIPAPCSLLRSRPAVHRSRPLCGCHRQAIQARSRCRPTDAGIAATAGSRQAPEPFDGQAASSTVTTRRFLKRARASSSLPILVAWRGSSIRRTSLSWTPIAAAKALLDSRSSRSAS